MTKMKTIPVGVSNRHIHLSQEHLEELFGEGYELTNIKDLTQKGEFAAKETVTIVGPKGAIENVRVLGPLRPNTQVEVSLTDSFKLGIKAPIRESGKIEGTPGCVVIGPQGTVILDKGVIIAERHVHMSPTDAQEFGVSDNDRISVHLNGLREVTYHNVLVRVKPTFVLELHLDTDEANAALVKNGSEALMVERPEEIIEETEEARSSTG